MTQATAPVTLIDAAAAPAAPAPPGTDWPLFLAIAVPALVLLVAANLRWAWLRRTPPAERAFRALARRRGIPPRRRRLVRALAAMLDDAEPVALLVSADAMARATAKFNARGIAFPPGTTAKDLDALRAAARVNPAADATPARPASPRPAAVAPRPR